MVHMHIRSVPVIGHRWLTTNVLHGRMEVLSVPLRQGCIRLSVFVVLGGFVSSVVGCGYTLIGASPAGSPRRIPLAVVPFVNQTREPDLESQLTMALRRAFLQSRTFTLASEAAAPRRLEGIVRRFRALPLTFDANDNVLQYRLEADILIRLVDRNAQRTMLEQEISAWAEYLVAGDGDVRENTVAKEAALFRLAQQFARKCTALLTVALL